jgi:hypothetical protein
MKTAARETAHQEAVESLDDLDVAELDDPDDLRRISAVVSKLQRDETELAAAVEAAQARGRSWSAIGNALGTTRQAAHARFGK